MDKILVLGSTGFLGQYLIKYFNDKNINFVTQSRFLNKKIDLQLNLENYEEILICLKRIKPNIIINLVALTNVDYCEQNEDEAYQVNALNVLNLTNAINEVNMEIHLVHISTDQVYSGEGPHMELDTKPINIYGKSKLLGDEYAEKVSSTILRTNFIGKGLENKQTLSDWIVTSLKNNININVFNDVFFNPIYINTLCEQIYRVVKNKPIGIYNLGSCGCISKSEFARAICKIMNLNNNLLVDINIKNLNLPANRPNDMNMNIVKYSKKMNVILPNISDEILKLTKLYI